MKPELLLLWTNKKLSPLTRDEMKDLPLRILKYAYDWESKSGYTQSIKELRMAATYIKKALSKRDL